MKKIVGDWSTSCLMSDGEAKQICKFGSGETCCAFLVVGGNGFECGRMVYTLSGPILDRLEKGTMNAKGEGGWAGCAWEGQLKTPAEKQSQQPTSPTA